MNEAERAAQLQKSFVQSHLAMTQGLANWPAAVPIRAQINEFIPTLCKLPYDYLFRDDPQAMAECSLLAWEYTGVDQIVGNLDMYNFELQSLGAKLLFTADKLPELDRSTPLISGPDDLDKIGFSGLQSGRYPYLIEYTRAYTNLTGLDSFPSICAPWSLACGLVGFDKLLVAALRNPEFVHQLLSRLVDQLLGPLLRALNAELPGLTTVNCTDAWFNPPLVSLDTLEEYEEYVYRIPAAAGLDVPLTVTGIWGYSYLKGLDLERLMALATRLSSSLTVFDPDVSNIGPEPFRGYADRYGLPLTLGLDSTLLEAGSIEEIVRRIKHYVLVGKKGLTPMTFFFNNINPQTPLMNIQAAVAAVRIYGAPEATAETPFVMPEQESFADFLQQKISHNPEGYDFNWLPKSGYAYLA